VNQISDEGLKLLMKHEGVHYQVYDDRTNRVISRFSQAKGYPTIGVGHRIYPKEQKAYAKYLSRNRKLTGYQVKELLRNDVKKFENRLNKRIGNTPVTQSMWDALVSLSFNTGSNSSSIIKASSSIVAKDYKGAAKAILNGPVKSKGKVITSLVKRRKSETILFMKDGLPKKGTANIASFTGIGAILAIGAFYGTRYVKTLKVEDKSQHSMSLKEFRKLQKEIEK